MKWISRKWRNDFNNTSTYDPGYDLFEDWDLIASSLKTQYGYSIRKEISDLDWGELISDIAGLNGETPLGNIVRIRKETDPEALKRFTPEENQIRNEWLRKSASQISEENYNTAMENIKNMFKSMADK
jgi:hypothetical protein